MKDFLSFLDYSPTKKKEAFQKFCRSAEIIDSDMEDILNSLENIRDILPHIEEMKNFLGVFDRFLEEGNSEMYPNLCVEDGVPKLVVYYAFRMMPLTTEPLKEIFDSYISYCQDRMMDDTDDVSPEDLKQELVKVSQVLKSALQDVKKQIHYLKQ
jgi:hypothetical protein